MYKPLYDPQAVKSLLCSSWMIPSSVFLQNIVSYSKENPGCHKRMGVWRGVYILLSPRLKKTPQAIGSRSDSRRGNWEPVKEFGWNVQHVKMLSIISCSTQYVTSIQQYEYVCWFKLVSGATAMVNQAIWPSFHNTAIHVSIGRDEDIFI